MCIPHEFPGDSARDPLRGLPDGVTGGVVGVLARVEAAIAELASWDANHADAGRADAVGVRGEVVLRVLAAQRELVKISV